jgi:2-polyprenyl-6-methoxyphenol hydroxylase-like FAD-dependent oxidoreductase
MSFKKAVVLGAAPLGLMAAIEARQNFVRDVTLVEKRGGYTRCRITNKLGFSFHKLAPTNYGAFGIFDAEEKDYTYNPERERRKQEANQLAKTVAGGKIGFHTIDHNYLLITLRNCSPADFKMLQGAPAELKKVLLTIGESYGAVVMKNLKEVDKNIALFEISIQRASQFYNQEYPAVLLGDSAVTPHPEKASGIGTGYFGFEKLKELFKNSRNSTAPTILKRLLAVSTRPWRFSSRKRPWKVRGVTFLTISRL